MSRSHPSSCSRSSSGSSFRKYLVPVTSDSLTFCRRFRAIRASLPLLDHDLLQRPWRKSHAKRHQNFGEGKIPAREGIRDGIRQAEATFCDRLKPVLLPHGPCRTVLGQAFAFLGPSRRRLGSRRTLEERWRILAPRQSARPRSGDFCRPRAGNTWRLYWSHPATRRS